MKFSLTLLLGLTVGAMAQQPPEPGELPPAPNLPSPVPSIRPAGEARRLVPPMSKRVDAAAIAFGPEGVAQPNMTGVDAAQLYEKVSGTRVILNSQVAVAEVYFVMKGPLTNYQAAKYLQMTLLGEGLALVPIPDEPDIVRMIVSGPITDPNKFPKEYIDNDPGLLPPEDVLVTYNMRFLYLKPEDAAQIFQDVFGPASASGTVTAVPNASSLIITENASLIRAMLKMKDDIDVASSIGEKWVDITYGDVDEIAERMNEVYNEQSSTRGAARTTRNTRNTPPAPGTRANRATPTAGGGGAGVEIPLKIIGVRRTSRILLVGRPSDIVGAEALIRSFDKPSSGKNRHTFRLRYLRIADFLPIAQNAIDVTLGESSGGGGGAGGRGGPGNQNNNNRAQQSNRNNNQSTGQQGGGGGGGNRARIQEQDIPTAPESLLVGRTLLVGDNVANTIIVNGPPHHIEIVRDLIRDLDNESQQVALTAVVGSYGLGDGLNFGVELAQALSNAGSRFAAAGRASFNLPSVVDPSTLTDLAAVLAANGAAGQGVSIYGMLGDDFGLFVNALETQTKFKTLERTVLTTRNNRVAELSSGQRIAIPSSTFNSGTTGQSTNVEYRDVTLELLIQPLINSDDKVTMEISLVRDSIGNNRQVGELIVPDINTEQLSTSVTVDDGSAVILGGVVTETNRKVRNGIPILRRIPGIGPIFGNTENTNNEAELIVMIQPKIVKTTRDLDRYSQDYNGRSVNAGEVYDAFPKTTGILPARGTVITPTGNTSKGGLARTEAKAKTTRKKKKRKFGRSGRPGSR